MRLISWSGISTIVIAMACGYAAGVAHQPRECPTCTLPPIPSREEEALPPPTNQALLRPRVAPPEIIDLTAPPSVLMGVGPTTPAVDPAIHQVTFEIPAGGDKPPYMPYLEEEPSWFMTGLNSGSFAGDLDIPIASTSTQGGIPPYVAPRRSFTAIALGYFPLDN
jgi:hypothetical protein